MRTENHSRRRVILGTGALVSAGTISSIALLSNNAVATADVSGEFSIPDGDAVLADADLTDIRLDVDVEWGFDANASVHEIELELLVGSTTETTDLIARHTSDEINTDSLTGTETLNGSLMSASDFSISDFEPSSGELRTSVVAELRFYATRNDEVVADASQVTTFSVVVSQEELRVDMSLDASGEVTFDTSE